MTIAFSRLPFNLPAPTVGFDDPWQRRHYRVQRALHQLAPLAPDGGRRVLWRCSQCQQPWYEASAASAVVPLSQEQGLELAARFGLQGSLENWPQSLCPTCSTHVLGGILRIEEQLSGVGYRFTRWSADKVWVAHLMLPEPDALAHLLDTEDLDPLLDSVLSQPTDVLLPGSRLPRLLQSVARHPEPGWEEIAPFAAHHLHQLAEQLPMAPGGYWRGCFWLPAIQCAGEEALLLMAVASMTPQPERTEACDLLEGWQRLFPTLVQYLSW